MAQGGWICTWPILRALQQRRKEDSLKLKVLRAQIKAGTDALDRGEFTEVDGADLALA